MTGQKFDEKRSEAFGDRLMDMLNMGSLALMTSIGHRTGLFDAMAGLKPSTSQQIADAASLNERYVREWLGGMLVGGQGRRLTLTVWVAEFDENEKERFNGVPSSVKHD